MQKRFCDTNVLMDYSSEIFEKYDEVQICGYVLKELEKHKGSDNPEKAYKARRAGRDIEKYEDTKVNYVKREGSYALPSYLTEDIIDNKIISVYKDLRINDNEIIALSNDLYFRRTCKLLDIPCEKFNGNTDSKDDKYNGIREVSLNDRQYINIRDSEINQLDCFPNEYIIINNTTKNEQYLYMWNGEYLEEVKVKPIINKYLSPKDALLPLDIYQKAFIHMLQNENVRVMITDSGYGCGKTYLMLHWALQQLGNGSGNGRYNKIYFVKSDSPPKGRKEIPAVPGGIAEKYEPLMGVILDTTSEDSMTEFSSRNSKVEILPIQLVKGRSLRGAILYINECQDFTPSEIERLLSRIGEDTVVLIDGSTKQIDNRNCANRNGLTVASLNFRDKSISAQVNMVEDYRSELSKMVSQMDWHD